MKKYNKENNIKTVKLKKGIYNIEYFDKYYNEQKNKKIDIIIPIYSGVEITRKCIKSIIQYTNFPYRIIAIHDCGPEKEMYNLLKEFEKYPNFLLIKNEKNLGFVKTINKGFSLTNNDVVVLNNDTEVFPGWLDSLVRAASWDSSIATVTPYSTNAGIFTLFQKDTFNDKNYLELSNTINILFDGVYHEVVTGHGFCMYIKRNALNKVGYFDEEHFGKGYCEETDFCLRCREKGFKNILDPACYIKHIGTVSFDKQQKEEFIASHNIYLNQRHPNYRKELELWKKDKEWKQKKESLFNRVELYLQKKDFNIDNQQKKRLLIVMQKSKGGSIQNRLDFANALSDKYDCYFLTGDWNNLYLETVINRERITLKQYILESKLKFNEFERQDLKYIYAEILRKYKIDIVNVSHVLCQTFDIIFEAKKLNLPIYYVFHDYYTICPTLSLVNGNNRCCNGVCSKEVSCPVNEYWLKNSKKTADKLIPIWRKKMGEYLKKFDFLVAPSIYTKKIIAQTYPFLDKKLYFIEHGRDFDKKWKMKSKYPKQGEKIRLVIIGNISKIKGMESIINLSKLCKDKVEIHLIGKLNCDSDTKNIIIHGEYKRNDLPNLIKKIRPHYGLIPSIFPETYCHTLTELWACRIPTIVYDVGVVAERMKKTNAGWIVSPEDVKTIYNLITNQITQEEYEQKMKNIDNLIICDTKEMANKYLEIIDTLDLKNDCELKKANTIKKTFFDLSTKNKINKINYIINNFELKKIKKQKIHIRIKNKLKRIIKRTYQKEKRIKNKLKRIIQRIKNKLKRIIQRIKNKLKCIIKRIYQKEKE